MGGIQSATLTWAAREANGNPKVRSNIVRKEAPVGEFKPARLNATKGLLLATLICCSCCSLQAPGSGAAPEAAQASGVKLVTQHEAEQSALAFIAESGGGSKITSYRFDRLVKREPLHVGSTLSGYFLCGQIEYKDPLGIEHGPTRIMVYFMSNFEPALILYDKPEQGTYAASSVCDEAQGKGR